MKALILSDIHGSAIAVRRALEFFENFKADEIWILGDTLYHGPRNPLPEGHGPMAVVEALMPYKEKIKAVRGNCDAAVDLMLLPFDIAEEYLSFTCDGKRFFLTHGHLFLPEFFSRDTSAFDCDKTPVDIFLSGHTHIPVLKKNAQGVLIVNPGSISLPKAKNPPTFAFYDNGNFALYNLETGALFCK